MVVWSSNCVQTLKGSGLSAAGSDFLKSQQSSAAVLTLADEQDWPHEGALVGTEGSGRKGRDTTQAARAARAGRLFHRPPLSSKRKSKQMGLPGTLEACRAPPLLPAGGASQPAPPSLVTLQRHPQPRSLRTTHLLARHTHVPHVCPRSGPHTGWSCPVVFSPAPAPPAPSPQPTLAGWVGAEGCRGHGTAWTHVSLASTFRQVTQRSNPGSWAGVSPMSR